MNDEKNGTQDRIAELEKECERLRLEVKAYRTGGKASAGTATLIVAGPDLVKAFKGWIEAFSEQGQLPVIETAELGAAVLRRIIKVGLVSAAIAIIPSGLLLWQNFLIRSQNQHFQEQNKHFQEQNKHILDQNQYFQDQNKVILEDSTRARRAELIATIYDEDCSLKSEDEDECPPKAHIRSRTEAALALIDIDRGQERPLSLAYAKLADANLRGADLTEIDLTGADLRGANLINANLADADLYRANLRGARLLAVHLELSDLRHTDLTDARHLAKERIAEAIISKETRLPDDLEQYREELLETSKENDHRKSEKRLERFKTLVEEFGNN